MPVSQVLSTLDETTTAQLYADKCNRVFDLRTAKSGRFSIDERVLKSLSHWFIAYEQNPLCGDKWESVAEWISRHEPKDTVAIVVDATLYALRPCRAKTPPGKAADKAQPTPLRRAAANSQLSVSTEHKEFLTPGKTPNMNTAIFPRLSIPETLAAGPGPGNTDARVLQAFSRAGVADHMQPDVLRGMVECKHMLRSVWGTKNTYTFGVAGTGWSGLDALFSAVMPGDTVVAFSNGTFSGIDALTLRIKAATRAELAADPLNPRAASVVVVDVPHGGSVTGGTVEAALRQHKPKWAFMAHWETGSGRINDLAGFSAACEKYGALGLVDAVSSLGVETFAVDDYPGVAGWASCPQKGLCCLPLTYAPVSFADSYIDVLKAGGTYTYVHNPLFEARHWGILDGKDVEKGAYHRTHSSYAVAAFHESLRLTLQEGVAARAQAYRRHEAALRHALVYMGCKVTSNMTSLLVLNLPDDFAGREMELVQNCRNEGFGIWPTLSEPVQIRVGILNQLNAHAISEIANRFADALCRLGAEIDRAGLDAVLAGHFQSEGNSNVVAMQRMSAVAGA